MGKSKKSKIIYFKGIGNRDLATRFLDKMREYVGNRPAVEQIKYRGFVDREIDDAFANPDKIKGKTIVFFECLKDLETAIRFMQLCWAAKKKYGAKKIIAAVSFFHYRRQDRPEKKEEIERNLWIVEMLKHCGIDHLVVATPHSKRTQENCEKNDIEFREVDPSESFASILRPLLPENGDNEKAFVYSPDEGSIPRAIALAKFLGIGVLFNLKDRGLDNRTKMAKADKKKIAKIIKKYSEEYDFSDLQYATRKLVKNAYIVMIEDEVDTGGTSNRQGRLLRKYGALAIFLCVTHPVLSDGWERKFLSDNPFTKIIMNDTIERPADKRTGGLIHDVSIAGPIASAVCRVFKQCGLISYKRKKKKKK